MFVKLWIFLFFCLIYGSCDNLKKFFEEVNGIIIGNCIFSFMDGFYLVISELVVVYNVIFIIEVGSEVVFVLIVGFCVYGFLYVRGMYLNRIMFCVFFCNEIVFCNNINLDRFYNFGIRFVGGIFYSNGCLEI